jgi:hypothetical protein
MHRVPQALQNGDMLLSSAWGILRKCTEILLLVSGFKDNFVHDVFSGLPCLEWTVPKGLQRLRGP